MAATNETSNLQLSQFVGSDKPDWLTDYNGDMLKIDSAYGAVNATAEQAASNAQAAATSAAAAAEDAAEALAGISGAIEAATAATTAAQQATQQATSAVSIANGAAATAQGAAGDATQALSVANNAKVTAENAQAAAAQAATDAAASATAATQAAADAASAAATATSVGTRVTAIENCVPSDASSSNKFATQADLADADKWADRRYVDTIGTACDVQMTLTNNLNNDIAAFVAQIDWSKITRSSKLFGINALDQAIELPINCIYAPAGGNDHGFTTDYICTFKGTDNNPWVGFIHLVFKEGNPTDLGNTQQRSWGGSGGQSGTFRFNYSGITSLIDTGYEYNNVGGAVFTSIGLKY